MVKIPGHKITEGGMPSAYQQSLSRHGMRVGEIRPSKEAAQNAEFLGDALALYGKYNEVKEQNAATVGQTDAFTFLTQAKSDALNAPPGEAVAQFESSANSYLENIQNLSPLARKNVQAYFDRNRVSMSAQILAKDATRLSEASLANLSNHAALYISDVQSVIIDPASDGATITTAVGSYLENMSEHQNSYLALVGKTFLTEAQAREQFRLHFAGANAEIINTLVEREDDASLLQAETMMQMKQDNLNIPVQQKSVLYGKIQTAKQKNVSKKSGIRQQEWSNLFTAGLGLDLTNYHSDPSQQQAWSNQIAQMEAWLVRNPEKRGTPELQTDIQRLLTDAVMSQDWRSEADIKQFITDSMAMSIAEGVKIDEQALIKSAFSHADSARKRVQLSIEEAIDDQISGGNVIDEKWLKEQFAVAFPDGRERLYKLHVGKQGRNAIYADVTPKQIMESALVPFHNSGALLPDDNYRAIDKYIGPNTTDENVRRNRANLIPTGGDDLVKNYVQGTVAAVFPNSIPAVDASGDPITDSSGAPVIVTDLSNPATDLVIDPSTWGVNEDRAFAKILNDMPSGEPRNQVRDAFRNQGIWVDSVEEADAKEILSNFTSGQDPNGEKMIAYFRKILSIDKKMLWTTLNYGYAGLGMEDGWQGGLGMAIMSGNTNELEAYRQLMMEGTRPGSNKLAVLQKAKERTRMISAVLDRTNPDHGKWIEGQRTINKVLNFATMGTRSASPLSGTVLGASINGISIVLARNHPDTVEWDDEWAIQHMQTKAFENELREFFTADSTIIAGHGLLPAAELNRLNPLEKEGMLRAGTVQDIGWNEREEPLGESLFGWGLIPQFPSIASNIMHEDDDPLQPVHTGLWNLGEGLEEEGFYPVPQNSFLMENPSAFLTASGGVNAIDANGDPISVPRLDANGEPIIDANGDPVVDSVYNKVWMTPVYEDTVDGSAPPIQGFIALTIDKVGNVKPLEIWRKDNFGNQINVTPDGLISEKVYGIEKSATDFLQELEMDADQQMFLNSNNYAVSARAARLTLEEGDAAFILWDSQWEQSELAKQHPPPGGQP